MRAAARGFSGDGGLQLRPSRRARLAPIEHERRGANAAQVGDQRAAVGAGLEMPLDVPLLGGVETPVDQVDEDISLEIGALHDSFFAP